MSQESKQQIAIIESDMAQKLVEAGLLPPLVKRFVIDCDVHQPVKIYYECYGDQQQLDIAFGALIEVVRTGGEPA